MRSTVKISNLYFTTLLLLSNGLVSVNAAIPDSIILENAFVRVMKNETLKSGANATIFGKRVIVALSKLKYKKDYVVRSIKRGEVLVYLPEETASLKKKMFGR